MEIKKKKLIKNCQWNYAYNVSEFQFDNLGKITFIYIYLPICKPINFHRFIAFCECFSTKNLQRIISEYSALKH